MVTDELSQDPSKRRSQLSVRSVQIAGTLVLSRLSSRRHVNRRIIIPSRKSVQN